VQFAQAPVPTRIDHVLKVLLCMWRFLATKVANKDGQHQANNDDQQGLHNSSTNAVGIQEKDTLIILKNETFEAGFALGSGLAVPTT